MLFRSQGFHSAPGPDGELAQAAAYCYAYQLVERLAGIDAFILHRHVDNAHEGGLRLGLRRNQPAGDEAQPPKKICDCFRQADTTNRLAAFEFALPIVGLKSWDEIR